jgi:DNA gyrase/topoisomerase IV subunit B
MTGGAWGWTATGMSEQLAARSSEVVLHGLGLAIIAVSSPLVTIEARRRGRVSTQTYSWGIANGPVLSQPADGAAGTRVTFTLPSEAPEIDEDAVLAQVDVWRTAHPKLRIDVQVVRQRAL